MSDTERKTSTGIQENVAGLLCYLGWWVTGIIFLILEKENKFIRFHATQSLILFGIIFIVAIIFSPIPFLSIIGVIVWIIGVILWIVMMLMAYQGKTYKLPWIGNLAEKYSRTAFTGQETDTKPADAGNQTQEKPDETNSTEDKDNS
jgi:uncharacterized membrane protein